MRLTLLHTNDVHGQIDGLARVATLVDRIRAESDHRVLYVDCGDVEETTTRLSNLTKGVAMHRLLTAAGCEAACVGNGVWLRYGPQVIAEQARAAGYPLLLGNLVPVEGVQATALLDGVGLVGVTDPFLDFVESFDYGLRALDPVEVVREGARSLRAQGAELVVCLSHLGLRQWEERRRPSITDPELAERVQGEVDLIVGAHSHDLLPEGERVGSVLIVQAGMFAEQLGRVEVDGHHLRASVIPVGEDVPPHPRVLEAAAAAEADLDASLDEVLAVLDAPVDPDWLAETLRRRMDAEIGLVNAAQALERVLPPGPLRRRELWEACHSTANPAAAELTGAQLARMVEIAADPGFQEETPRTLRGRARGRLHVVGAPAELEPERRYRVAATDYELESYGGMVEAEWRLDVRYDFPTILREAIEEELTRERLERPVVQGDAVAPEGAAGREQPLS